MNFEGVTFVESECVKMGKAKFVKELSAVHWLDRTLDERKQMLADAYDMMSPPKGKTSASKEEKE